MKLHLESNIVEGTPEELVKYQELLEADNSKKSLFPFGHEHQLTETEQRAKDTFKGLLGSLKVKDSYASSTDIQVGDRVKVLKSASGAEGEATVTAVLEYGVVEVAGTNKDGQYLTNWANHVSNLEKIEDVPKGYTFWYIDGGVLNHRNVLKVTLEGHFEDSKGRRYSHQAVSGFAKPLDREDVREKFEKAENYECLLKYYPTVDVFAWK